MKTENRDDNQIGPEFLRPVDMKVKKYKIK